MLKIRLKHTRIIRNLTQQNMADALGIALRSYQRYEEGTTEPNLDNLILISKKLEVSTDYLLGLTDEAPFD